MAPIISVANLSKTYASGFQALKGINLEIRDSEIFALLGPNGAGKTTLIGIICGIVNPSEGAVSVAGHDIIASYRAARSMIGLVPQELATDAFESVWATVSFSRGLFGKKANPAHIEKVLKELSLWDKKDSQIRTLSGGMRRRLEIARGLVHSPRIFFLDEPTTGLDPVSRVAVWEMLTNIKSHRQLTILITTHYMDEADRLCDRIAIVDHGKLVALDTPPALKASVPGSNVIEAQFDNAPAD